MTRGNGAWSLRRNFIWVLAGEIVNRVLPLVVVAHAARTLGSAGFGRAQFVLNLVETAVPCVVFGYTYLGILSSATASRVAPEARRETYARLCVLRLAHAVVTIAVACALLAAVPGYEKAWIPFLAFSPALLLTAFDASYLFIAGGQSGRLTRATTVAKLAFFAIALGTIRDVSHSWRFVACMLAVNAATILYGVDIVRREGIDALSGAWRDAWRKALDARVGIAWMRQAFPFALVLMVLPFFERGDVFAVERLLDAETSGRYQALAKLAQSALGVLSALMLPFLPAFLNVDFERDSTRDGRPFRTTLLVGTGVAGTAFLGAAHFGREAMTIFYGRDPGDDVMLLPIVFLALFPAVIVYVHGLQILLLRGRPLFLAAALGVAFAVPTAVTALVPRAHWDASRLCLLFLGAKIAASLALLVAVHACRERLGSRAAPALTARFAAWMIAALAWCLATAWARGALLSTRPLAWDPAALAGGVAALAGFAAMIALAARDLGLFPLNLRGRPHA